MANSQSPMYWSKGTQISTPKASTHKMPFRLMLEWSACISGVGHRFEFQAGYWGKVCIPETSLMKTQQLNLLNKEGKHMLYPHLASPSHGPLSLWWGEPIN